MSKIIALSANSGYWQKGYNKTTVNASSIGLSRAALQFAGSTEAQVSLKEQSDQDSFEGNAKRRKLTHKADISASEATCSESEEEDSDDSASASGEGEAVTPYPQYGQVARPPAVTSMKELIKPLSEEANQDLEAYKQVGGSYSNKLHEIISRAYLNNAVLKSNDSRLRKGILMGLKDKLSHMEVFSVDCSPSKMTRLPRDRFGSVFGQVFSQPANTLGLPKDKTSILILDNVSPGDAGWLRRWDQYHTIKKVNPNFRFIINGEAIQTAQNREQQFTNQLMMSVMGRQQVVTPEPTGPAPFEDVYVPSLNATQWHAILQKDNQAQEILAHWKLEFPKKNYLGFLETLISGYQGSVEHYQILNELDRLGSFIRIKKQDATSPAITDQHLGRYTTEILGIAQTLQPQDSSLPVDKTPLPYTIIKASDIETKLDDVVGHKEVKEVLTSALKMAKYPAFYAKVFKGDKDARMNYVLLMGEPGNGKTMLAKAIAAEGQGTFISTTGSHFVNQLSGMGAANIRRLQGGIENASDDFVTVFIDEIDSLSDRDSAARSGYGGNEEDVRTINQFLAAFDGISSSKKKVMLIGATNRPHALDDAILRRFHHKREIKKLNREQREELLKKLTVQKNLTSDSSVDLADIARRAEGLSGSDVAHLMKLAKEEIIQQIPDEEKERLEHDPQALEKLDLTLTDEILRKALKDVIEGIKKANTQKHEGPISNPDAADMYR